MIGYFSSNDSLSCFFREEDKHTAIDINIASLTESFDAAPIRRNIEGALQEVLKGRVLGTYKVDSTSLSVGTPLLGITD